jgi:hypothetical protein
MVATLLLSITLAQAGAQELTVRKADLIGEYSYTDGFTQETLTLKANGTFDKRFSDCTTHLRKNNGTWKLDGDAVTLTYAAKAGVRRLVPVQWRTAYYLVQESELPVFVKWASAYYSDRNRPALARMQNGATYLSKTVSSEASRPKAPKAYLSVFQTD